MRLLTVIARYYFVFLLLILTIWSAILFMVLRFEVYENVDEVLEYRKRELVASFLKEGKIPPNDKYHDFHISETGKLLRPVEDTYSDTLLYRLATGYDEYRKINSYFLMNGQQYKLSLIFPRMEQEEMAETLIYSLPIFLLLLFVGYLILRNRLSKRIWSPFFTILSDLRTFSLERSLPYNFKKSNIYEFNELQNSMMELTEKSIEVFLQQKQFTENASHELQTPLAIIQTKIELLFQKPLDKKQSEILLDISEAAGRISKINEALLLLTKIDNKQFHEKETVKIRPVIDNILLFFEEFELKFNISTSIEVNEQTEVKGNLTLLTILFTNLLKNAFVHNIQNGSITISFINNHTIVIANTGSPLDIAPEKIFERFYTQASRKGGIGLGLAIVKSICNVNGWMVDYKYVDAHQFTITF